jgi:integrase
MPAALSHSQIGRPPHSGSGWSPGRANSSFPTGEAILTWERPSTNHLHRDASAPKVNGKRKAMFPADFVLHSLRHTMLTRLGESGVDAFTIMRIAGHSSIVVSQRYTHPTPGASGAGFRAAATVRRFCRNRAKTTATRYSIRYTRGGTVRKSLKGL